LTAGALESPAEGVRARPGRLLRLLGFFRSYPNAALGALLTMMFVSVALAAPLVHEAAYDQTLTNRLQPPVWQEGGDRSHLLGTDGLGRDVLARIMTSIRISLMVATAAVLVAAVFGIALGSFAGYVGGWMDDVLMRFTDAMLAIPLILLAITVMAVIGANLRNLILVIAAGQWMIYARTARAEALALRELQFVTAARSLGAGGGRILRQHILPHILPSAIALMTLNVSIAILLEAGLSFLGLGVQLPTPSIGSMLTEGRQYITRASWLAIYPGLTLLLLVLGINLLGDGLRSYLDPHSRTR
jgi:peptide/nickel transport system permease protein